MPKSLNKLTENEHILVLKMLVTMKKWDKMLLGKSENPIWIADNDSDLDKIPNKLLKVI